MKSEQTSLVSRFGDALTSGQRKQLKSLGHPLQPVVLVGQKGISPNLIENVQDALLAHELIKIKVHDSSMIEEAATSIHEQTGAHLVQHIGKILLFYKKNTKEPKISL